MMTIVQGLLLRSVLLDPQLLLLLLLLLLLPTHISMPQAAVAAPAELLADEDDELRERLNAMRTT
jgi:hypothetical protein